MIFFVFFSCFFRVFFVIFTLTPIDGTIDVDGKVHELRPSVEIVTNPFVDHGRELIASLGVDDLQFWGVFLRRRQRNEPAIVTDLEFAETLQVGEKRRRQQVDPGVGQVQTVQRLQALEKFRGERVEILRIIQMEFLQGGAPRWSAEFPGKTIKNIRQQKTNIN